MASQSPARREFVRTEMLTLSLGDERKLALVSGIYFDAIAAALSKTSTATSDLKLNGLSVGEQIQVPLAELGVMYLLIFRGFKANRHKVMTPASTKRCRTPFG